MHGNSSNSCGDIPLITMNVNGRWKKKSQRDPSSGDHECHEWTKARDADRRHMLTLHHYKGKCWGKTRRHNKMVKSTLNSVLCKFLQLFSISHLIWLNQCTHVLFIPSIIMSSLAFLYKALSPSLVYFPSPLQLPSTLTLCSGCSWTHRSPHVCLLSLVFIPRNES